MALIGAIDPGSTRMVYAMVAGLVIVGTVFVLLGVWLVRQTRVDPQVLAPLERMSERDWKHKDSPTQRRLLDEVRPPGALPLRPEPAAPSVDTEFGSRRPPESLSDLGPGVMEPMPSTSTSTEAPSDADFTVDADGEVEAILDGVDDDDAAHAAGSAVADPVIPAVGDDATPTHAVEPERPGINSDDDDPGPSDADDHDASSTEVVDEHDASSTDVADDHDASSTEVADEHDASSTDVADDLPGDDLDGELGDDDGDVAEISVEGAR